MFERYDANITALRTVARFCDSEICNKRVSYPGNLRHYELIYTVSGNATVTFGGKVMKNAEKSVRFMPAFVKHAEYYVDATQTIDCIDIFFDTDYPVCSQAFTVDCKHTPELENLFNTLLTGWEGKGNGYYYQCLSLLYKILDRVGNVLLASSAPKHLRRLEPASEYIRINFCSIDFDISILPSLCGIGSTYFRRLFNERYGMSPSRYIKQLRVKKACELLTTGRHSVGFVSSAVGYDSIYYFSRVFKSVIGVTPSEYSGSHKQRKMD